jgi:hypothetical protein
LVRFKVKTVFRKGWDDDDDDKSGKDDSSARAKLNKSNDDDDDKSGKRIAPVRSTTGISQADRSIPPIPFQNLTRNSTHALLGAPGAKNVALCTG